MKKIITALLAIFASAVIAFASSGSITIYLSGDYIPSGETRVIEVIDEVRNVNLGQFSVVGSGAKIPVGIGTSDAGYGRIRYRNVTNNSGWTTSSFLKDGEAVKP